MIRCPSCSSEYASDYLICPNCGISPRVEKKIPMWAPELAYANQGFKEEYFSDLADLEGGSFWFKARNALICWGLRKYFPNCNSFLEIGCGTGFVLANIAKNYPTVRLAGSEIYMSGLEFAKSRSPNVNIMQMDARNIPYIDEFDVVGAFDVLEHIREDDEVLNGMFRAIKPGGGLLVTVPQHPILWSAADDYACHVRRYASIEIHTKIEKAGFHIIRSTSFVSLLLPALLVSRLKKTNLKDFNPNDEFQISPVLNQFFAAIMYVERIMIHVGVSIPVGGSRLIVAKKIKV